MARLPKPYWKASHHAWYATINGKVTRLGTDKADAFRKFHAEMAAAGKPDHAITAYDRKAGLTHAEDVPRPTVGQLIDKFLDDARTRTRHPTWDSYRRILQSFCDHGTARLEAIKLRPFHVTEWLNAKTTWSKNRKSLAARVVKNWARWCKASGHIDTNPIADLKGTTISRRKPPPPGTISKLRAAAEAHNPELATFIDVSLLTGCRPGELEKLSASSIDWETKVITVAGKTGSRAIPLTDRLAEILRPLANRWPTGPILRTPQGKAWHTNIRNDHLSRACKKAGISNVCSYMTRGIYATEALRNGVDGLMVSKLLGHKDPSIVYRFYASPDEEMIRKAAEKAIGNGEKDGG